MATIHDIDAARRERVLAARSFANSHGGDPAEIVTAFDSARRMLDDRAPRVACVIAIGRNVGEKPMSDADWVAYRRAIDSLLRAVSGTVYARTVGQSVESDWGREETALVSASIPESRRRTLTLAAGQIARHFRQDAIALTFGETVFAGGAR